MKCLSKAYSYMLASLFTCGLTALALMLFPSQAFALSNDVLFQNARDAYAAKNEMALTEDVSQLKSQEYILAPYADYWLMLLRLDQATDEEVQNFLTIYADMPFTDRLRGEWLKKLAKQENWVPFFDEYGNFHRVDIALQCYALLGHLQLGDDDVTGKVKALWFTSADLPSNCDQLFDAMQKTGALSTDDIWERFRLALQDGKLAVATSIAGRLPSVSAENTKMLDRVYKTPQLLFDDKAVRKKSKDKINVSFKSRFGIELGLYAVDRLARTDLDAAIITYKKAQTLFDADDRAFGWGRIAYHAAQKHHPDALSFYALADKTHLDKDQLAWRVRAALRIQDWAAVLSGIAALQPKQLEEGVWRYWKARALKEQGHQFEANVIFSQLSKERHFYGWLAADEVESLMSNPDEDYKVTDAEVSAIASQPSIKRALELQRLDMRWEAKSEWAWAIRNFDDKQLLAAAEYAMRQQWYDVAINTADSTKKIHNFNLRYPTPYRDLMRSSANIENIDEAWVYGLTRQESRFMHYAKSGVGASGLMQLMPATAKWVAKQLGMEHYNQEMIHTVSTNIEIGTHYMRHALDLMNGQAVMATAAYNAGPSRAKRWMASEPLEAAIYMETIPYSETRNYVQKVMANAHFYASRLGMPIQTLKSRLGVIPGSGKPDEVTTDAE
ncbi:soluble lytic murein transglycosylase precursor [mine drainage metagenome]|uniref:Soluble lytic murein transglycosylase n=1 Tax=mine drainage metagenome TaxID=410659 RepID=A0A1J5SED5_9ZZZZ